MVPELSCVTLIWLPLICKIRFDVVFKTASGDKDNKSVNSETAGCRQCWIRCFFVVSSVGASSRVARAAELWRKCGGRFQPHLSGEGTFYHPVRGKTKKRCENSLQQWQTPLLLLFLCLCLFPLSSFCHLLSSSLSCRSTIFHFISYLLINSICGLFVPKSCSSSVMLEF